MAYLTELQVEQIKQHVLQEDDALRYKYKAKSSQYDTRKVLHAEVEHYEELGWVAGPPLKTKTPISLRKGHDRQFEDDIWCMFYNLGFRTLNADEKLVIQWGQHETEKNNLMLLPLEMMLFSLLNANQLLMQRRRVLRQS